MKTGALKKTNWGEGGIITTPMPFLCYKDAPEYFVPISKLHFPTRKLSVAELKLKITLANNILEAEKLLKHYGNTEADIKKMWYKIQWVLLNLFSCSCEMRYRPFLRQSMGLNKVIGLWYPEPKKPLSIFNKWYNWGKALLPNNTQFNPYLKGR